MARLAVSVLPAALLALAAPAAASAAVVVTEYGKGLTEHSGATDRLHALALLVTYPARLWLASRTPPPRPGRQPAVIQYF
jgi:uncharacterized protein (DUF2336 family)